jgi:hypothetical protein
MRAGISSQDANSIGGSSMIFDSAVSSKMVPASTAMAKAKALNDDPFLACGYCNSAIQRVLDILPDETLMLIEACLTHRFPGPYNALLELLSRVTSCRML